MTTGKDISALTPFCLFALCAAALMYGCCADAASGRVAVRDIGYEVFEPVISIAWVDDTRLLFVGSKSGLDSKRRSLERGNVYLWDETTRAVLIYSEEAIEYRFCLSQGRISYMIRIDKNARRAVYREGLLGSEQEVEKSLDEAGVFSRFSCRLFKFDEFVPPLSKSRDILVLREGDGYLALRPKDPKEQRAHPRNITLHPEKGEKSVTLPITWDERIGGVGTTYSEYLGVYVLPPQQLIPGRGPGNWPADEPRIVYLLHPGGRVGKIQFPPTNTFYRPSPVKSGWIYGGGSFYKTSGLYLFSDNAVQKIDSGNVKGIAISPNGCKALVAINNRHLEMGTPIHLKILDFCVDRR